MWPVLFALLPVACSRPAGLKADDPPTAANSAVQSDSDVPFRDSRSLPVGTLLTVRLKSPIAADSPGVSRVFDAIVDESVLVEGSELLPRGVSVAGRVESARASGLRHNRGYVRLTLDSINIAGRELSIRTSSLFVRGNADEAQASASGASLQVVRLEGGRRLTFRLTEPLSIASPPDTSAR